MIAGAGFGVTTLIFDRAELSERGVSALPVVEDLKVLEDRVGQLESRVPPLAVQQLDLPSRQNDSIWPLSLQSPIEAIDGTSPESSARRVKAHDVNWVP